MIIKIKQIINIDLMTTLLKMKIFMKMIQKMKMKKMDLMKIIMMKKMKIWK